jgi:hypothetical protein
MFHNQDRQSMRKRTISIFLLLCGISVFLPQAGSAQQDETSTPGESPRILNLAQAVMCEDISANAPRNQTVVFSVAREKAVCFTSFDKVPAKTFIYHNWFYKDIPSARIRLALQPPRWSTFSSIQIRKTDIGPWRVEVTDENGRVLHVLRFSITD